MERKKDIAVKSEEFFYKGIDLMCIASIDGYFKQVNQSFESTLGYSEYELTNRSFFDFIHPEDITATQKEVQKLEEGQTTLNFINRYQMKSGNYRWLSWNSKFDETNKLIYATARDITELIKIKERHQTARNKLQQSNEDLEAFSYSVSHDLRTPLRAITGFSQILLEDHSKQLDNEGKRMLNVIIDNTQRMGDLIDDILDFSRVSRSELVKTKINMTFLFREAIENVMDTYSELKENLEVSVEDLPFVYGDLPMLKQVAINLISNAVKYSSRNKQIHIKVGYLDKNPTIYFVEDNGIGFDMKYANKLFGVFQRLHSSSEFEGTGIGLSLVKRIIDAHKGKVWAKSKPGCGTTFYFQLPKN